MSFIRRCPLFGASCIGGSTVHVINFVCVLILQYDQTPLHLLSIQENWLNTKNQSAVLKLSELLISYNADVNLKDKVHIMVEYVVECNNY